MNLRIFTLTALFLFSSIAFAQEKFATGARFNVSAGTGFGIYNLSNNEAGKPDGTALSGNLQAAIDYGFLPFLTVGVAAFRNGFATNKDSSESARIAGIGLFAHLNFVRRPKATWYLSAGLGGTGFLYQNYGRRGKVTSTGGYAFAGLGFRRYFGDHFGIYSEINVTGYNYDKFTDVSDSVLKTPSDNNYGVALSGAEVKFGLIFALGPNGK
jgi:hypothetical protein